MVTREGKKEKRRKKGIKEEEEGEEEREGRKRESDGFVAYNLGFLHQLLISSIISVDQVNAMEKHATLCLALSVRIQVKLWDWMETQFGHTS